jgi:hypothetical protein
METLAFPLLVAMQLTYTQQYLSGEHIHVIIRPRLLDNHATRQYRVAGVSMCLTFGCLATTGVSNLKLPNNDGIRPNTSQYIYIPRLFTSSMSFGYM